MASRYSLSKPKYPMGCTPLDAQSEIYFLEPNTTRKSEMDFNNVLYGIVKKEPYDIHYLDDDDVRALIRDPLKPWPDCYHGLQMIKEDGTMRPAHLPNYYDMYGIISNPSTFNSKLKSFDYSKMETVSKVVPPNLKKIADPLPVVNLKCPIYRMRKPNPTELKIGFGSDALFVYHVHGMFTTVNFAILTSHFVDEAPASRFYGTRLTPTIEKYCPSLPIGTPIVVWNVRDVSRPSFMQNFQALVEKHQPGVIILLETRATMKNWTRLFKKFMNCNFEEACLPRGGLASGVIVLWDANLVDCETMFNCGGTCELLAVGSVKVKVEGGAASSGTAGEGTAERMRRSRVRVARG